MLQINDNALVWARYRVRSGDEGTRLVADILRKNSKKFIDVFTAEMNAQTADYFRRSEDSNAAHRSIRGVDELALFVFSVFIFSINGTSGKGSSEWFFPRISAQGFQRKLATLSYAELCGEVRQKVAVFLLFSKEFFSMFDANNAPESVKKVLLAAVTTIFDAALEYDHRQALKGEGGGTVPQKASDARVNDAEDDASESSLSIADELSEHDVLSVETAAGELFTFQIKNSKTGASLLLDDRRSTACVILGTKHNKDKEISFGKIRIGQILWISVEGERVPLSKNPVARVTIGGFTLLPKEASIVRD